MRKITYLVGLFVCLLLVSRVFGSSVAWTGDAAVHVNGGPTYCYDDVISYGSVLTGSDGIKYKIDDSVRSDTGTWLINHTHGDSYLPNTLVFIDHTFTGPLTSHPCASAPGYMRSAKVWVSFGTGVWYPDSNGTQSDYIPHNDPL